MHIVIERDGCISCGLCASACPEVYRMADDGLAEVFHQPDAVQEDEAGDAAANCPVGVISAE